MVLGMRQAVHITVDGSGRGQHEPMEASLFHVLKQAVGGVDVDLHGGLRVLHRSRNGALSGQMNHGVNALTSMVAYIAQHNGSSIWMQARNVKHGDLGPIQAAHRAPMKPAPPVTASTSSGFLGMA